MQCTRNLSTFATNKATDGVDRSHPLSVLFATVERVSVTVTFRHELRAFDFVPGPIGMEIEYKFGRLLCTNVMPNSQASTFAELLEGSEIVAVNGRRVISLQDFQCAVVDAHAFGKVTITAACYKRGKKKLDKFYEHLSSKNSSVAKSLFSGLLAGLGECACRMGKERSCMMHVLTALHAGPLCICNAHCLPNFRTPRTAI